MPDQPFDPTLTSVLQSLVTLCESLVTSNNQLKEIAKIHTDTIGGMSRILDGLEARVTSLESNVRS